MVQDGIMVILKGILYFFCNPVLYFLIAGFFLFGWQRVRRERRSFGLKVYGVFNSVMVMIVPSLLLGLIGTIILVGVGISLPVGVIVLITACYFLTFCVVQLRFLSPVIAVGLALIIAYFFADFSTPFDFLNRWIADINHASLQDMGIVLTVVTLLEAVGVLFWGGRQTSPRLITSNRGKKVGAHEAYQLWIVPVFILIPTATSGVDAISWWPFSAGHSFGLCLLPLGIGFQQLISHSLPLPAIRQSGRWLLGTTILIALFIGISFFYFRDECLLVAAAIAVLSRIGFVLWHYRVHHAYSFFFTNKGNGLMVVGIIPNSPADYMNVKIGEIVDKVNGRSVRAEEDFYHALQINAAYCKLDILDYGGEVRFAKAPVYENDLHNIGFLFLEPSRRVVEKVK